MTNSGTNDDCASRRPSREDPDLIGISGVDFQVALPVGGRSNSVPANNQRGKIAHVTGAVHDIVVVV
jgi:hypothetical protein